MTDSVESAESIHLVNTFPAAPERLYASWTDPIEISQWFGSRPGSLHSAEVDLRPGGRWRFTESASAAGAVGFEGHYIEVEQERRLVFSWSKFTVDAAGIHSESTPSQVEVNFEPVDEGTKMTIIHSRISDRTLRDDFAFGWGRAMAQLKAVVAP